MRNNHLNLAIIFGYLLFLGATNSEAHVRGTDARVRLDMSSGIGRFVGKITWKSEDHRYVHCSATLVKAANRIVTAQHCLPWHSGQFDSQIEVWFYPALVRNQKARRFRVVSAVREKADWEGGEYAADWAIADLEADVYPKTSAERFAEVAPLFLLQSLEIYAAGYPLDRDEGKSALTSKCQIIVQYEKALLHQCDIYQGMSGGPVYATLSNGDVVLIGINIDESLKPQTFYRADKSAFTLTDFNLSLPFSVLWNRYSDLGA